MKTEEVQGDRKGQHLTSVTEYHWSREALRDRAKEMLLWNGSPTGLGVMLFVLGEQQRCGEARETDW